MIDVLPQRGLIGLGYWGLGFRNVTNSKLPLPSWRISTA